MKTTAFTFSLAWSEIFSMTFRGFILPKTRKGEESGALDTTDRLYNTQQLKELKIQSILCLRTDSESSMRYFLFVSWRTEEKEKSFW